jgi:hypothetical protein
MTNSSQSHPAIMSNSPCMTGRPQKWIIITIINNNNSKNNNISYLKHGFTLGGKYFEEGIDCICNYFTRISLVNHGDIAHSDIYILYIYIHAFIEYISTSMIQVFLDMWYTKIIPYAKKVVCFLWEDYVMTGGSGGTNSVSQKQQVGWFNQPQMYHPSEV